MKDGILDKSSMEDGHFIMDNVLWEGGPYVKYFAAILTNPYIAIYFFLMGMYCAVKVFKLMDVGFQEMHLYEIGILLFGIPSLIFLFPILDQWNLKAQKRTRYVLTPTQLHISTGFLKNKHFTFDRDKISHLALVRNPKKKYGGIHFRYADKIKFRTFKFSKFGISPSFVIEQVENPEELLGLLRER